MLTKSSKKLQSACRTFFEDLESRLLMSTTLSFQQGVAEYVGGHDTQIRQDAPATSYGNFAKLLVDRDDNGAAGDQPVQALVRFDEVFGGAAGRIPAGSSILSATLTIRTGTGTGDGSVSTTALHRMHSTWDESSTWNSLTGGVTNDGIEAAATPTATFTPVGDDSITTLDVTSDVQAWASDPTANFGWALLPQGDNAWRWDSSEATNSARRPLLTITYEEGTSSPGNEAPTVDAGPDLTVTLPATAALDGTAEDDGVPNPPGVLATTWSYVSGPGAVLFADSSAVDTSASFSASGTYTLRLSADDGSLVASDTVTVTVLANPDEGSLSFQQGVGGYAGTQDTQIRQDTPTTSYGGLGKLTVDADDSGASGDQPVQALLRFDDLVGGTAGRIPAGSSIVSATLTIRTGTGTGDGSVSTMSLHRMLSGWDESSTWNSLGGGITADGSRAAVSPTASFVPVGDNSVTQLDVTADLQAWASNPTANFGWVLLPHDSNAWRWDSSEAADPARRPSLAITYVGGTSSPDNQAPAVNAGPDLTITAPNTANLDGTVFDDGLPNPPGALVTTWSYVSGPGTVLFADSSAVDTTASFSAPGSYVLRLTADDGVLTASDTVTITVQTDSAPTMQVIDPLGLSQNTGEKPQSKLWEHDGRWWGVFPNASGTWVWRLDDTKWTSVLRLTTDTTTHADVKAVDDVTHILMLQDNQDQLASIQYVPGSPGTYQFWSQRPSLTNVSLGSRETAVIDIDGDGLMWVASEASTNIEVRYSAAPYTSFSSPIRLAENVLDDDISTIVAMPDGAVGVLWSNQQIERFGFRMHHPGTAPTAWTADEVPAWQSAQDAGGGMADDHLSVAVASDGTLYAAVKTSYDRRGYPQLALLVRRPSGQWDPMYEVDTYGTGTRSIIVLNETRNRLMVIYPDTGGTGNGNIVYRESPMDTISFGPKVTVLSGQLNNPSTNTKQGVSDDLVITAGDTQRKLQAVRISWPDAAASSTFASSTLISAPLATMSEPLIRQSSTSGRTMLPWGTKPLTAAMTADLWRTDSEIELEDDRTML